MDKLSFQNQLKELYFENQPKVKYNRKLPYHCKTTHDILKNITKQGNFSKIKERLYIAKVLEKILLKSQLNWISYSYINAQQTLVIIAKNHVAQSELNYHKEQILNSFKSIEKYKTLLKVSILRDIKKNDSPINIYKPFGIERSYGIFHNNLKNPQLYRQMENIRKYILSVK